MKSNESEIAQFYQNSNINMDLISQKYAYFLAVKMGMKKEWMGRKIDECHRMVNSGIFGDLKIKMSHF